MSASALPPHPRSHGEALGWTRGPQRPRISPGEVHVWCAQLGGLGVRSGVLSEAERERERQIVSERDRQTWGRSRSVLRMLLARYLDGAPEQVPLAVGANGKPCLGQAHDERHETDGPQSFHFNLSHSGELALYAFSSSWPVGIDVELVHEGRRRDHVALTRRVFGEREARRVQALAPAGREREFLRLWTRYEAALKRVGRGIGAGADAGASDAGASDVVGSAWIVELDVGMDGAAALAGEQAPSALQVWKFGSPEARPTSVRRSSA